MIYCIENQFNDPIQTYQWGLVNYISKKFPFLTWTKRQKMRAHFSLKYKFETDNIIDVEKQIKNFIENHKPSPLTVGGFDHFNNETVFIKIQPSEEMIISFNKFIDILENINWMQWNKYDGKNLHFHMTIAEKCNGKGTEVIEAIKNKEKTFDSFFDNITILTIDKIEEDGLEIWKTHKKFLISS